MKPNALALLKQALALQEAGRLKEAEGLYQQVLRLEPSNPDALNLLGGLAMHAGEWKRAVELVSRAVRLLPRTAFYHNNLGLALQGAGQCLEAAAAFQKAAQLDPALYDAWFNLGVVLQKLERLDEAIAAYQKALTLQKEQGALNNLGAAYRKCRKFDQAIECFQQVLALSAQNAEALYNLGLTLEEKGQSAQALACFEKRARLPQPPPELARHLGVVLQQAGRRAEAEQSYRRALQQAPDPVAANNLGLLLQQRFAFPESEALLRQAIRLNPADAEAFNNLGNVLMDTGRSAEAELAYSYALQLKGNYVEAHYNRSYARLSLGKFEAGWPDYEYRWQWKGFPSRRPPFTQPAWDGQPLHGRTLLVYHEQGLGDAIQFSRYFAVAASRGARVLYACPAPLQSLLAGMPGLSGFVDSSRPLPPFDVHAALMSLPFLCGTRLESIPAQVPYLPGVGAERFPLPPRSPGRLRVGIVWAGGTAFPKDGMRSLSLAQMVPLLRGLQCEFFSLQAGPKTQELSSLPADLQLPDLGSRVRDFADTAAIMGQLDLVISTCTAPLHLAGALGRPVWALLSCAPDWRWLCDREDSPWYPSMRLFRQRRQGDWTEVLQRVRAELVKCAERYRDTHSLEAAAKDWFRAPASLHPQAEVCGRTSSPAASVAPQQFFMSGQISGGFGWGTVNRGLFDALSQRLPTRLIGPADPEFLSPRLPGPFLTTLLGNEFTPECPARGQLNLGNAVFEQELPDQALANARRLDVVFTASSWCLERLKARGISNGVLLLQGINTQVFHPAPLPAPRLKKSFVLFSGGKFELRKGQDLVLRAFRVLSRKYPDLTLVTAWHNLWPVSLQTMAASPYIRFELKGDTWPDQLAHLCQLNGIDPKRVVAIKPSGPEELARVYQEADLGIFPNRCEGATNLVLMEFMACGRPVVASYNSGHCDVVREDNALLLKTQRAFELKDPSGQVSARWYDGSVDELIAQVEHAYAHRELLAQLGAAAARDLKAWDWSRAAGVVLNTVGLKSRSQ